MSPQRLGARGSAGKGWGSQRQWPDGLCPPCTAWHVSDAVLPSTSYCILCWPYKSTSLSAHTGVMESWSHPAVVLPISLLACFLYICLSQLPHAAPYGTSVPVCTTRGRNDAQQPESSPVSQFSHSVSPSTHIPSPIPLHATHHSSSLRVQTDWVVGIQGLENQQEEPGPRPRALP